MSDNDVLVLMTDGYFEWSRADDDEQFGLRRLRNCIADSASGTAEEILANLDSAVRAFAAGSKQIDDTTALVIKRKPVAR
jgi:serine phosphatase RsbU (regulator of sigma subunit)